MEAWWEAGLADQRRHVRRDPAVGAIIIALDSASAEHVKQHGVFFIVAVAFAERVGHARTKLPEGCRVLVLPHERTARDHGPPVIGHVTWGLNDHSSGIKDTQIRRHFLPHALGKVFLEYLDRVVARVPI